jgi:hypothetical protein
MDELDTDTNEEDAIPSPMGDEGKPPSSPVDSGTSNNPALAKINSFSQDKWQLERCPRISYLHFVNITFSTLTKDCRIQILYEWKMNTWKTS